MASTSRSAARKRLDRLVNEHAEELLALSPRQKDTVMEAAWTGGKPTAYELIKEYRVRRSHASSRAAATKLMNRKHSATSKILRTMGPRVKSPRKMEAEAPMLSLMQVREIERRDGVKLIDYVQRGAAVKPAKGERNPLWYRG